MNLANRDIRELQEEMHRERLRKLWQDARGYITVGVIAILTLTASISGYKAFTAMKAEKAGDAVIRYLHGDIDAKELAKFADSHASGMANLVLATAVPNDRKTELAALDRAIKAGPAQVSAQALLMKARIQFDDNSADADATFKRLAALNTGSEVDADAAFYVAARKMRLATTTDAIKSALEDARETVEQAPDLQGQLQRLAQLYMADLKGRE